MAVGWDKPWKVVADAAPGFASVNRFQDNLQWAYESMARAHGIVESLEFRNTVAYPPRTTQLGHHSTQAIPRAVLSFALVQLTKSIYAMQLVQSDPHVVSVTRLQLGSFFVEIAGLSTFWGEAWPYVANTTDVKWCIARTDLGTTNTGVRSGIYVDTTILSGGDFVASEFSFTMAVYGAA